MKPYTAQSQRTILVYAIVSLDNDTLCIDGLLTNYYSHV